MKRPFPNKSFYSWYFMALAACIAVIAFLNVWLAIEVLFYGLVIACLIGMPQFLKTSLIWLVFLAFVVVLFMPLLIGNLYPNPVHMVTGHKLRTLTKAINQYVDEHKRYPTAFTWDEQKKPLLSWRVTILPQLGYADLYKKFHHDEPWDSPHNLGLLALMPDDYQVSRYTADLEPGHTILVAVTGPDTILNTVEATAGRRMADFHPSYSALLTLSRKSVPWTAPFDLTTESTVSDLSTDITVKSPFAISRTLFNSGFSTNERHLNTIQMSFADGSVHSVNRTRLLESKLFPKLFKLRIVTAEEQEKQFKIHN